MKTLVVLLGGDAMTGRGVDQILPFPSNPHLEESFVKDARAYLKLAVRANGPLSTPVDFRYLWGDALAEMDRARPAARIVNLETSVTRSDGFWPGKGIHYRMSPENAPCLSAAGFDVCCLANNHTLDFGRPGLLETIGVLRGLGLRAAGAGRDADDAWEPALLTLDHGAIQVFALGTEDSGIPPAWAAATNRPGINLIPDLSSDTADRVAARIARGARDDAVVVVSIHWGGNWGYRVPPEHVRFARSLVEAGVDIVHGHSSHHPRPIEIYRDRLILYGCGEFIDDYEGIAGYEHFRDDLVLMYFATVEASGALVALSMIPMQIKNLRLTRPSAPDTRWLAARLDRICRPFSTRVAIEQERLVLRA